MTKRIIPFMAALAVFIMTSTSNVWAGTSHLTENWDSATPSGAALANAATITGQNTWTFTKGAGLREDRIVVESGSDNALDQLVAGGGVLDVGSATAALGTNIANADTLAVTIQFDITFGAGELVDANNRLNAVIVGDAAVPDITTTSYTGYGLGVTSDLNGTPSQLVMLTNLASVFNPPTAVLGEPPDSGTISEGTAYTATCTFTANGANTDVAFSLTNGGNLIAADTGSITGAVLPGSTALTDASVLKLGLGMGSIDNISITSAPLPSGVNDWRDSSAPSDPAEKILSSLSVGKYFMPKEFASIR